MLLRAAGILSALLVPVVALFEGIGVSIPIALGVVAPPVAALWLSGQVSRPRRAVEVARTAGQVFRALPGLRNEALLFFAANAFALGLSSSLDAATLLPLSEALPGPAARILLLVMAGVVVAGLGIHPIVPVVAVGIILSPEVLGLSDLEVALSLLVVWGMGTAMSPFSATVLQVSRLSGVSPFAVAWRWNAPFYLLSAPVLAAVVYLVTRVG